ncbi:hypothetical protein IHE45_01G061000 [Dioscorea alata]|uniref:Uncharacterized protein n=1 Tax=Dioscorea alata TaxID=55571 RepID=A0ACB7WV13_DIOAL|nr:hypothetical protein IHE45_01G061000 [Dioscorea alata]
MAALTTKLLLSKPLSPSDTQLLSHLHSLITTYHQSNPPSPSSLPPSPSFLSPSLSSSFSALLPSPPSPSLVHSLIHLLSLPNHSPPFLPTLSFFNWYLSIHPSSSPPSPLPFLPMLDFAAKLRHFHISWHFLDLLHSHSIPIPPLRLLLPYPPLHPRLPPRRRHLRLPPHPQLQPPAHPFHLLPPHLLPLQGALRLPRSIPFRLSQAQVPSRRRPLLQSRPRLVPRRPHR